MNSTNFKRLLQSCEAILKTADETGDRSNLYRVVLYLPTLQDLFQKYRNSSPHKKEKLREYEGRVNRIEERCKDIEYLIRSRMRTRRERNSLRRDLLEDFNMESLKGDDDDEDEDGFATEYGMNGEDDEDDGYDEKALEAEAEEIAQMAAKLKAANIAIRESIREDMKTVDELEGHVVNNAERIKVQADRLAAALPSFWKKLWKQISLVFMVVMIFFGTYIIIRVFPKRSRGPRKSPVVIKPEGVEKDSSVYNQEMDKPVNNDIYTEVSKDKNVYEIGPEGTAYMNPDHYVEKNVMGDEKKVEEVEIVKEEEEKIEKEVEIEEVKEEKNEEEVPSEPVKEEEIEEPKEEVMKEEKEEIQSEPVKEEPEEVEIEEVKEEVKIIEEEEVKEEQIEEVKEEKNEKEVVKEEEVKEEKNEEEVPSEPVKEEEIEEPKEEAVKDEKEEIQNEPVKEEEVKEEEAKEEETEKDEEIVKEEKEEIKEEEVEVVKEEKEEIQNEPVKEEPEEVEIEEPPKEEVKIIVEEEVPVKEEIQEIQETEKTEEIINDNNNDNEDI